MIDEREKDECRHALEQVIATQGLEGLEIDAATRADMDKFAAGELTIDEALNRLKARVDAGFFDDHRAIESA